MDKKVKHLIKKTVIIVASVVLVLVVVNMWFANRAERYIRTHLTEAVEEVTGGLYNLELGKLKIDILQGYLSAKDIRLNINTERYKQLEQLDSLPDYTGIIKIKSLRLTGVNFKYSHKLGRKLGFRRLIIEEPEVIALSYPKKETEEKPKNILKKNPRIKPHTLYDFIAPYFDEFFISHISLIGGNAFLLRDEGRTIKARGSLTGLGVEANDFKINSNRTLNNSILFSENIIIRFDSLLFHSVDGFYDYFAGATAIDIARGEVTVNDPGFTSPLPKWEFAHVHPTHADWFDLKIGQMILKGLNMRKLVDDQVVLADTLLTHSILLQNFKNGQIPIEHNYMPMVYTSRQELPIHFFVDYVNVSNMEVIYEELATGEADPGRVTLTNMEGVFLDYTNIVSHPNQTTTLYASAKLMGEGELETIITLPVDPAYDRATLKANLGVMNMISLNPIIETMGPAKLDGGFIQGLDLYIDGGGKEANVEMTLLYNDLSVQVLQNLNNGHKANRGILSLLANGVIEKNNPQPGQEVRTVHALHIRDPLHSSFNYLWKIILSGLVKVLGYTDERQERVEWAIEELGVKN